MSRSSRKNNASCFGLIFLAIFVLVGIIYTATGSDLLGIFTSTGTPQSSTLTPLLPPTNTFDVGTSVSSWWEIYFTDPLTVNDPNNYAGSIEDTLIQKINAAQTSIHIASFEFNLTPVAEALVAAHNRGVDVRWVTDDESGLGADGNPGRGQFALLQNAGIQVRSDDRSALMHNKFWVFDGQTVWSGSTNITASGIFEQDSNVIVIHSPEVAAMYERQFSEMWDGQFGPQLPSTVELQSANLNGTNIQVLFSPEDHVVDKLIALVNTSQASIRFLAFSFTDYPLADAMRQRAAAGVDVSGVWETVGSETDASELKTLFCAHIPVRQDGNPQFMHNKFIVIDSRIVITGSLNYSSSADESNNENVIILDNPDVAALYLQYFDRIWGQAHAPDPVKIPCQ